MERETKRRAKASIIGMVYFVVSIAITVVMLLTASVIWLSELLESVMVATLVIGGGFLLVSILVYHLSVRQTIERLQDDLDTIIEVTTLVKGGYNWIIEKIALFLTPRK